MCLFSKCQFLLGKVQQNGTKIKKTLKPSMCQFLLGKVQQYVKEDIMKETRTEKCQFLLGKVQHGKKNVKNKHFKITI